MCLTVKVTVTARESQNLLASKKVKNERRLIFGSINYGQYFCIEQSKKFGCMNRKREKNNILKFLNINLDSLFYFIFFQLKKE